MGFETKWDIVVVGGAIWDYLVRGPALPTPGGTVRGDDFQEAPGGKGTNQAARACRALELASFRVFQGMRSGGVRT